MFFKGEIKNIGYGLAVLFVSAIVGLLCLCLVYLLPVGPMKKNVKAAYDLFMDERVYHDWSNDVEYTRLDGYTDMIMYNTAIYEGQDGVLTEALMNRRIDKRGEEGMDLPDYLADAPGRYEPENYERYWHGYLIWLKPLLLFMNPRNIRVFNMIIQFTLFAYFVNLLGKKFDKKYFVQMIAGILLLNPVSTAMCLQYSSIYYIVLFAMIIELKFPDILRMKSTFSMLFLCIGICVAYFDFLTYPPIALCFPLFLYLMVRNNGFEKVYEHNKIMSVFRAGVYWVFGYIGMWSIKWILPLLVGHNQFENLLYKIKFRSDFGAISLIDLLFEKICVVAIKPFLVFFTIVLGCMCVRIVRKRKIGKRGKVTVETILSYALVGIIPIGWYFIARQHSTHTFAYRNIAATIMAGLFILEEVADNKGVICNESLDSK